MTKGLWRSLDEHWGSGQRRHRNVHVHGKYEEYQLPALLRQTNADIIWFPGLCPETYSYTLSFALASGLPIIAFEIGAISERLREVGRGVLLPIDMGEQPDEIVHQLSSAGLPGVAAPVPRLVDQLAYYGVPTMI